MWNIIGLMIITGLSLLNIFIGIIVVMTTTLIDRKNVPVNILFDNKDSIHKPIHYIMCYVSVFCAVVAWWDFIPWYFRNTYSDYTTSKWLL